MRVNVTANGSPAEVHAQATAHLKPDLSPEPDVCTAVRAAVSRLLARFADSDRLTLRVVVQIEAEDTPVASLESAIESAMAPAPVAPPAAPRARAKRSAES